MTSLDKGETSRLTTGSTEAKTPIKSQRKGSKTGSRVPCIVLYCYECQWTLGAGLSYKVQGQGHTHRPHTDQAASSQ